MLQTLSAATSLFYICTLPLGCSLLRDTQNNLRRMDSSLGQCHWLRYEPSMAFHTFPHITRFETACLQGTKALAPGHLGPRQDSAANSLRKQSTCSEKCAFTGRMVGLHCNAFTMMSSKTFETGQVLASLSLPSHIEPAQCVTAVTISVLEAQISFTF